jgi:phosphatidylglycerol:prolipoprotein diacylglycerol transferase
MTVYPLVFNIGPLEVTGFGIMMMLGFFTAGWVIQKALIAKEMNDAYAEYIIIAGVVGGILGAKLWYVALHPDAGALFDRGGLVWYGGFLGGTAAIFLNGWRLHVPTRLTMELAAPAVAVGHAIGRVGCFVVQDDYGVPTSLPWGLRFPEGVPPSTAGNLRAWGIDIPLDLPPYEVLAVHPTQLYEVAAMLFVFWMLWRLRDHAHGMGWLAAVYLMAVGVERFLVEFIRAKDDRMLDIFTIAQLASIILLTVGALLAVRWRKKDDFEIPDKATVLQKPAPSPSSG